jgi:hypothetical protein
MEMNCVGQFAYVALYEGLANAVHGRVQIVVSRAAPAHLSKMVRYCTLGFGPAISCN